MNEEDTKRLDELRALMGDAHKRTKMLTDSFEVARGLGRHFETMNGSPQLKRLCNLVADLFALQSIGPLSPLATGIGLKHEPMAVPAEPTIPCPACSYPPDRPGSNSWGNPCIHCGGTKKIPITKAPAIREILASNAAQADPVLAVPGRTIEVSREDLEFYAATSDPVIEQMVAKLRLPPKPEPMANIVDAVIDAAGPSDPVDQGVSRQGEEHETNPPARTFPEAVAIARGGPPPAPVMGPPAPVAKKPTSGPLF